MIVIQVGKNLSVIVSNVYAPNDHNEEYFDHLKDIMLDVQIVHPTLPIIMLEDFNILFSKITIIFSENPKSGFYAQSAEHEHPKHK